MNPIHIWTKELINLFNAYRSWSGTVAKHSDIKGNNREFFIRNILSRFLPDFVSVGTGQIIDKNENISNQIDITISDGRFPTLTSLSTFDIFFAESILATIELKSALKGGNEGSLREALNNCRSVQQLEYNIPSTDFYYYRQQIPATYILGLKGYKQKLNSIKECIQEYISQEKPSYFELPNLIITEGIVVIKNTFDIIKSNDLRKSLGYDCLFVAKQDDEALSWMIFHLMYKLLFDQFETEKLVTSYFRKDFNINEWEKWGKVDRDSYDENRKDIDYDLN